MNIHRVLNWVFISCGIPLICTALQEHELCSGHLNDPLIITGGTLRHDAKLRVTDVTVTYLSPWKVDVTWKHYKLRLGRASFAYELDFHGKNVQVRNQYHEKTGEGEASLKLSGELQNILETYQDPVVEFSISRGSSSYFDARVEVLFWNTEDRGPRAIKTLLNRLTNGEELYVPVHLNISKLPPDVLLTNETDRFLQFQIQLHEKRHQNQSKISVTDVLNSLVSASSAAFVTEITDWPGMFYDGSRAKHNMNAAASNANSNNTASWEMTLPNQFQHGYYMEFMAPTIPFSVRMSGIRQDQRFAGKRNLELTTALQKNDDVYGIQLPKTLSFTSSAPSALICRFRSRFDEDRKLGSRPKMTIEGKHISMPSTILRQLRRPLRTARHVDKRGYITDVIFPLENPAWTLISGGRYRCRLKFLSGKLLMSRWKTVSFDQPPALTLYTKGRVQFWSTELPKPVSMKCAVKGQGVRPKFQTFQRPTGEFEEPLTIKDVIDLKTNKDKTIRVSTKYDSATGNTTTTLRYTLTNASFPLVKDEHGYYVYSPLNIWCWANRGIAYSSESIQYFMLENF